MLKCALSPHEGAGGLARPLQDVGEPAALRDFSPVFVRFGSILLKKDLVNIDES